MKPSFLLAAIGVALTALIGYHGIYARQQEQVRVIQAEIAQEQANEQARAEAGSLFQELEQLRARLPAERDPSWLAREVVAHAEAVGLRPTAITQQAPQTLPHYTRLAVVVQFHGTYHQIGALVDRLERAQTVLRVEQLDAGQASGQEQQAMFTIGVSTLYVPPATGAAG